MAHFTEEDVNNFQYVAELVEDRVPHTLDFSDDRQWSFFMRQVADAGVTAESHPAFYQSLLDSRDRHVANGGPTATPEALFGADAAGGTTGDPLQNANEITSLGVDVTQIASLASAFSSIIGGTVSTFLSGYIFDPSNMSNPLGYGQIGPVYGAGEYVPLGVAGRTPSGTGLQFQFTYSYQPQGQFPVQQTVKLNIMDQPVGAPTVSAPVYTPTNPAHPSYIKIGIGRDPQHTPADCNYWYNEPNINNPNIRCPAVGSQVFGSNILTPLFDGSSPTRNLIVAISLSQTSTGGTVQVLPIQSGNLQNFITANGNTLRWNFAYNSNVQIDTSMQFGAAAWVNDTTMMLNFSLGVLTVNSPTVPVWVNLISMPAGAAGSPPIAGNWGTSPSAGQYIMWPIFYTWHCVGAGARIRLADGSTAAIEDLVGGERVKNGPGDECFTVVDTWRGTRETELLALEIDGCDALLLTSGHPVMTPDGLVAAGELTAGCDVLTEQGPAKLRSVSTQPYSGPVYTFAVGNNDEEVARFTDDNTCVYANGILIADHRATIIHAREKRFSLETVLSRIPPEYHDEARRWYPKQRQELESLANLGLLR